MTYGDETPTKTRRFVLTSKRIDRLTKKVELLSRFLSKTAAVKMLRGKVTMEKWYGDRGIRLCPRQYQLKEFSI